ncbi:uncharacterized protein [Anoplolepis gracilipes]|uniref:uncharacterized protein isoform X4 n=1 Tax=Anoplolepis gracilipes TaxID=354296 RepID=UPI003B9FFDA3
MMVFPEEKYYRLNYIFLASIGLWPYHNSKINQIQVALSLLIYIIFVISQLIQLFVTKYTLDLLLEILSFDFLIMAWASKYISFYAVMKNIKRFQKHVRDNWSILTDDREIDIMRKHAENGKRYTIVIATTTGVATESFSLINAVHVFGMYKIASYRIEHMINKDVLRVCIAQRYTILHHRITAAVDVHRRALELSELLKESFGRSYLILITIIICSGSINLFHFFRIITMKQKILEIGISLLYIACHFLFLILGNFFGQEFINSDSYFHQTICNTKWYNTPLKVQKLILFLLQKTTKSYKLDAGGMFSPCFEGLITTISLLFSFVTVLCSIQ